MNELSTAAHRAATILCSRTPALVRQTVLRPSDFILRYALQKNGLDPNKDVSILQTGGQPEGLAAMASGKSLHNE
jgi:hypothetical protein